MKSLIYQNATIKPSRNKTQQAYVDGWNLLAKIKILAMEGRRDEVLNEVRRAYNQSVRFHFYKLSAEFATFLQYYYILNGDPRRGSKYNKLSAKFEKISHYNYLVEYEYVNMAAQLNNTRNPSPKLRKELETLINRLEPHLQYDCAQIHINVYALRIAQAYLKNDLVKVIRLNQEIIQYLEERGIERTSNFYKDLTPALIMTGKYDEAEKAITQAIVTIPKGSYPWSMYLFYQFILQIHKGDYEQAYQIFQTAERKRQVNKAMAEQWLIVKGFIRFLIRTGRIDGEERFRLSKFLNEVPVFSKDKEGNNINILILKLILSLKENNDQLIDQRAAIEKYIERHLKEQDRARLFLKMLLYIPGLHFNKAKIIQKTKPLSQQLEQLPMNVQQLELEIIPYHQLWQMILPLLR